MRRLIYIFVFFVLILHCYCLTAGSVENGQLNNAVQDKKNGKDISMSFNADEKKSIIFNLKEKIDPFKPCLHEDDAGFDPVPGIDCPQVSPLQQYDLSQLKLTGIILGQSGNRGLIIGASEKGFIIKEGDYIGSSCGTVLKIKKDRIVVEEKKDDSLIDKSVYKREILIQGSFDNYNQL